MRYLNLCLALSKVLLLFGLLKTSLFAELMKYQTLKDNQSIYGTLHIKGSPLVENLSKEWLIKFEEQYPEVRSSMDFKNTTQGIKALMDGSANIAVASRKIHQKEIDTFKRRNGYVPTEIKVSLNALAIYVNRQNPIESLSIPQLDAIFSSTLKREYINKIENWKDITPIDNEVNVYLNDINSSTRAYFKKRVMLEGEFNANNLISDKYSQFSDVLNQVASDMNGICFGSIGSKDYKVKILSLSRKAYFPSYKPNVFNIQNEKYPLTRFFYIYLSIPKDKPIPKLFYEFCKYILSKEGQKAVTKIGGLTLSSKQVGIELAKIRR